MLIAGKLLLESNGNRCRLSPGFVRIDDGIITEVVEGETPKRCDLGGPNHIIAPGFIDAHVHLPQFDIIGGHGMPLLDWLNKVTFPSERRWEDIDFARAMIARVLRQCISHGTTSLCAYATVHHASAVAAIEMATEMGIGGAIGQVLMDREAPDYLRREANQLIDECGTLMDRFPQTSRMSAAVTPRFAISCSPELLSAAGKLAQEHDAIVQTHLAETLAECEVVSRLFDGQSYVQVYGDAGLLTPRSIFGHGIHLDKTDRSQLANSRGMIAHCPTANSFLRSGTMNRSVLMNDQVHVCLGSDVGAGYERSMVRVGRAMIEAASLVGDCFPTASEAWHSITAGNAERLGFDDRGRIRVGNSADLVVIEPNIPIAETAIEPLSVLMFAWDDRWIQRVLIRGQVSIF